MKKFGQYFSFFLFALITITVIGCGSQTQPPVEPIFTDPALKIAELSSQDFTVKLFYEAVALEPKLDQAGTRVSIGFWSRFPNRDNLVVLLNAINGYVSPETYRAIWDEGTSRSWLRWKRRATLPSISPRLMKRVG